MTSASLAHECIQVVAPLLKMIVDDDENHNGQLKYSKEITTASEAKQFLEKISRKATDACTVLKSGLDQLEKNSKKIDRKSEEGILIHMLLQSMRLLPAEISRLEKLDGSVKIERHFPADRNNKYVLALQNLIKKHNGDTDAESVVSLSDSVFANKETKADSSESVKSIENAASQKFDATASESEPASAASESKPASTANESEPASTASESEPASTASESEPASTASESEPAIGASESEPASTASESEPASTASESEPASTASESEPASGASESEPASGASESEPASGASESEPASVANANAASVEDSSANADDVSLSLIEEATEMLEEPIAIQKTEIASVYGLSREELTAEKKKYKTHKQKDAFIETLISALMQAQSKTMKEEIKDKESVSSLEEAAPTTEKKANASQENAYVVEDVSKFKRSKDGIEQVLVKWKNYPIEEMTWENKTDTLTRSNVGGTFFQASDTSYKKFCERVGLLDGSCAKIQEKDKKDCEKRNAKKTPEEKQEDCSVSNDESDVAIVSAQSISDAVATTSSTESSAVEKSMTEKDESKEIKDSENDGSETDEYENSESEKSTEIESKAKELEANESEADESNTKDSKAEESEAEDSKKDSNEMKVTVESADDISIAEDGTETLSE